MKTLSPILRIIEGVKHEDLDKIIRYAKRIVPKEEWESISDPEGILQEALEESSPLEEMEKV